MIAPQRYLRQCARLIALPAGLAEPHTRTHARTTEPVSPRRSPLSGAGVLTLPELVRGPSAGPRGHHGPTRAHLPRRCGARSPLSRHGAAVPSARPAPPPSAKARTHVEPAPVVGTGPQSSSRPQICSVCSSFLVVRGIALASRLTHEPTGKLPVKLSKEDEIPQQREVATSPTRQEVMATEADYAGLPPAARRRMTTPADDGRHLI